jgi:hypothetical protein
MVPRRWVPLLGDANGPFLSYCRPTATRRRSCGHDDDGRNTMRNTNHCTCSSPVGRPFAPTLTSVTTALSSPLRPSPPYTPPATLQNRITCRQSSVSSSAMVRSERHVLLPNPLVTRPSLLSCPSKPARTHAPPSQVACTVPVRAWRALQQLGRGKGASSGRQKAFRMC